MVCCVCSVLPSIGSKCTDVAVGGGQTGGGGMPGVGGVAADGGEDTSGLWTSLCISFTSFLNPLHIHMHVHTGAAAAAAEATYAAAAAAARVTGGVGGGVSAEPMQDQ